MPLAAFPRNFLSSSLGKYHGFHESLYSYPTTLWQTTLPCYYNVERKRQISTLQHINHNVDIMFKQRCHNILSTVLLQLRQNVTTTLQIDEILHGCEDVA